MYIQKCTYIYVHVHICELLFFVYNYYVFIGVNNCSDQMINIFDIQRFLGISYKVPVKFLKCMYGAAKAKLHSFGRKHS